METKQCSRCRETLPTSSFHKQAARSDGLQSYCKKCNNSWNKDNPESWQNSRLMAKFGITLAERDEMAARQLGLCLVCELPLGDDMHVDHDHSCCGPNKGCPKCVRGILHGGCNRALGLLHDDPKRLQNAINYLMGGR